MPTHQQLRAAIGAASGRFPLADNRMSREIDSLVVPKRTRPLNVLAGHRDFTQIVYHRGHAQRKAIATTEVERAGELIRNHRDARCVRIWIALEFVGLRTEAAEGFDR